MRAVSHRTTFLVIGCLWAAVLRAGASDVPLITCEAVPPTDLEGLFTNTLTLRVANLSEQPVHLGGSPSIILEDGDQSHSHWALLLALPWPITMPPKTHWQFLIPVADLLWNDALSSTWPKPPSVTIGEYSLVFDARGCRSKPVRVRIDERGWSAVPDPKPGGSTAKPAA